MHRTMIAAVVAAAVTVVGCASDAAAPPNSDQPTSSPSAASAAALPIPSGSPRASNPPAPQPSGSPFSSTITWEHAATLDGRVTELFADGDVLIAGGWHPVAGPAAWTSADGTTWTRAVVENQEPMEIFAGPHLGTIARVGDSLLSFGTFIGPADGRGVYGWRSRDGTSWEAIESSSPLFENGYLVERITAGDPGLVAVENQFAGFAGRFWTWTEATSWIETTPGSDGEPSGIQVSDVIWSQGRFVAVGSRPADGDLDTPRGTSWVSTDGRTWKESAPDAVTQGVNLSQVASLPEGGFLALGTLSPPSGSPGGSTVALSSPDGLVWTAGTDPFDYAVHVGLVEIPGGVVAFMDHLVWATSDGVHWTQTGSVDGPFSGAAVMGNDIVVFTVDFENDETRLQRGVIDP